MKRSLVTDSNEKDPENLRVFCGVGRDRTGDTRIFSPLLYRLSYRTSLSALTGSKNKGIGLIKQQVHPRVS